MNAQPGSRTFIVRTYNGGVKASAVMPLPEYITWLTPDPADREKDQLFIGTRLIARENWKYDTTTETLSWHQGQGAGRRSGILRLFSQNYYGIGHLSVGSHYYTIEVGLQHLGNPGVGGHYLLEFDDLRIRFSVFGQQLFIGDQLIETSTLTGTKISWNSLTERQVLQSGLPVSGWCCFSEDGQAFDDGERAFFGRRMNQDEAAVYLGATHLAGNELELNGLLSMSRFNLTEGIWSDDIRERSMDDFCMILQEYLSPAYPANHPLFD